MNSPALLYSAYYDSTVYTAPRSASQSARWLTHLIVHSIDKVTRLQVTNFKFPLPSWTAVLKLQTLPIARLPSRRYHRVKHVVPGLFYWPPT